ncbi:hypothetical protein OESDEN_08522 [Oesophagostomum dentatum]|uniref:Uncharacterized protein n=1 Tax=Oesophagostomum dentatum TaxID=61180 RepID=A0A0B1T8D5_OESDE|nr:hypothetical protein OESDEN_08522 [Oesophagostomum dentatum]
MSTTNSTSFLAQFFSGVRKNQTPQGSTTHAAHEDMSLSPTTDKLSTDGYCVLFLLDLLLKAQHIVDVFSDIMSTTNSTSFLAQFFSGVRKNQTPQGSTTHAAHEDMSLSPTTDKLSTGSNQSMTDHHGLGCEWGRREHLLRLAFVFDTNNY